jgi:hypothetical protein
MSSSYWSAQVSPAATQSQPLVKLKGTSHLVMMYYLQHPSQTLESKKVSLQIL